MRKIDVSRIPTPEQIAVGDTEEDMNFAEHIVNKVYEYLRGGSKGSLVLSRAGFLQPSPGAIVAANRALAEVRWLLQKAPPGGVDSGIAGVSYNLVPLSTNRVDVSRVPFTWGGPSPCDNPVQRVIDAVTACVLSTSAVAAGHGSAVLNLSLRENDWKLPAKGTVDAANEALAVTPWTIKVYPGLQGWRDQPVEPSYRVCLRASDVTQSAVPAERMTDAVDAKVPEERVDVSRVPDDFNTTVSVGPIQHLVDQIVRYVESGRRLGHLLPLELTSHNGATPTEEDVDRLNVALTPTPWHVRIASGPQGRVVHVLDRKGGAAR